MDLSDNIVIYFVINEILVQVNIMGIELRWLSTEKTRIHIIFEQSWTLDEFQYMVLRVRDMIEAQDHPVHVIANFTFSATPSSSMLLGMTFAMNRMAGNFGVAVVVTQNETIHHLAKTAISMHHELQQRVYIVRSLEVAERILAHQKKQKSAVAR